jgi:predicted ATPase/DNA-binding CsgD family transcriptional regulator
VPDGSSVPAAGRLPTALTSLVGRVRELAQLTSLLRTARLLTLTGTGGSGKTRLGLALAESSRARFADGAWWVDLTDVTGPGHLAAAAAAALGIPQSPGQDTETTVRRHLESRESLVVFDNCEQVVAPCAELIENLLRCCPGLTVVATSREVIGVPGELVFRVGGLRLTASGSDGQEAEAVDLFTQRARTSMPEFLDGPAERAAVAGLCRRLDGLPLAIELAAARVSVLGVAEIADRLDQDARILRHPSRMAPARHQTLEATLDWSHRLLTEPEQILFRRLSAFRGSFSLAAVEAVAVGGGIERADVVDLVAGLVDKSLVLVAGREAEYRYRMLETIRQYGEGKLGESGEQPPIHAAHSGFYLSLAEQAQRGLEGTDQASWLERLELEHDNLRAVLRRTLPGQPEVGAPLTALLWPFWYRRGYYHEARSWLELATSAAAAEPISADIRAAALTGAGVLAFLQCDYQVAAERLSKARALYEEAGNRVGLATTLQRLGSIAREEGRYADARRLHGESLAIWTEIGDDAGAAASLDYLGFAAWLEGNPARAVALCSQAVAAFRASGRRQETAAALINLGVAAHLTGDDEHAAMHLRTSLNISTELGYQEGVAWALHELAVIIADEHPAEAADMLRESLTTHLRLGDRWRIASVVETIAELAVAPADAVLAATLLGASNALRLALGTPVPGAERPALDTCLTLVRGALGEGPFARAWRRGEAMTLDELADAAGQAITSLGVQAQPAASPAQPLDEFGLTTREMAVLRLLSQGLTNREIGRELLISAGTAGVHVSNILRKLGVSSRVQAATIAQRTGASG